MDKVRWLLFDVGGVLCTADDERWPNDFGRRWAARLGMQHADFEKRVADADLPDPAVREGVEGEFWARYGRAVGATAELVENMREDFWDCYCGTANAELINFAAALKQRVGLAILSNSGDGAREQEERRFGFSKLFDPICYSHEMGVTKPAPDAFRAALTAMNTFAEDVVFIDNVVENVAAARSLGMNAVLHRRNAETIDAVERLLSAAI